jgi:hypothetical protein
MMRVKMKASMRSLTRMGLGDERDFFAEEDEEEQGDKSQLAFAGVEDES